MRFFRANRDKAQLAVIHNTRIKNRARPKMRIRKLSWWKPREAGLLISKVCYSVRKHLRAASPALPSWVLPNARSSSLCASPTTPHSTTSGTIQGFQATDVLEFSSSAARKSPSSGKCLGRGHSLPSPRHPLEPQKARVLCKPWGAQWELLRKCWPLFFHSSYLHQLAYYG